MSDLVFYLSHNGELDEVRNERVEGEADESAHILDGLVMMRVKDFITISKYSRLAPSILSPYCRDGNSFRIHVSHQENGTRVVKTI